MSDRITLPLSHEPRVSIIVAAAFNPQLLRRCLASLERNVGREIAYETIVVLNGAGAAVRSLVRDDVRGVKVADSPANLGFPAGSNLGRAFATGELLVLLHDDAEVEPGWLEALVDAADRHPEAGAIGSKALWPGGTIQAAGALLFDDATTLPLGENAPAQAPEHQRLRAVDYCGSCSLLVRSSTWDAIGELDEEFFPAGYVDADLCMSVRREGQVVLCEPRSCVRHHRSAGTETNFKIFVHGRNRARFQQKWREELARHGPAEPPSPATIAEALARVEAQAGAIRATRSEQGAAETRPPVHRAGGSFPTGGDETERLRAALRFLKLDVALKDDYIVHCGRTIDSWRETIGSQRWELDVRGGELEAQHKALDAKRKELDALRDQIEPLISRSAKLEAIEQGGWWRLRGRLLPVLRVAAWIGRRLRLGLPSGR